MSLFDRYFRLPDDPIRFPPDDSASPLVGDFKEWIRASGFPCVGAKAALSKEQMTFVVLPDIRSSSDDERLHAALLAFVANARRKPTLFRSFAALFETPDHLDEQQFEQSLWKRVQSLSDRDVDIGHGWDERVSADPTNPHFSLSVAGEAFFVVGLHPQASRPARRFSVPTLVFNMHAQFEQLRTEGRYEALRSSILERDRALAGTTNPMLERFGKTSEARQYSGRSVSSEWRCPFAPKTSTPSADGEAR